MTQVLKKRAVDNLEVKIYETRKLMGESAAHDTGKKISELLAKQDYVNIIFAAAPSQNEFLEALTREKIEWSRVNAFHMDEYIGLDENHPERFSNFLKIRLFDKVPLHKVNYLGSGNNSKDECQRYAGLLKQYPPDIVCMGIGENTHVAFNDPYVADFNDVLMVKEVKLHEDSRRQQVHDNCFASIEEVPHSAITLTVPTLFKAKFIYCIVPGSNKAQAVYHTIYSDIKEEHPSTMLRRHPNAILYLDKKSAEKLNLNRAVINS